MWLRLSISAQICVTLKSDCNKGLCSMTVKERKTWAAVEFEVALEDEELAGWIAVDRIGAAGCEVKPTGSSDIVLIHATFDSQSGSPPDVSVIRQMLEEHGLKNAAATVRACYIVEEDWLAKFKEGFKPFQSGDRLVVCPPWDKDEAETGAPGRKILMIEPGMAFGTGLHATTRFCLRAIEKQPMGSVVLDVGTGSGILAIATALLHGGTHVIAIDNDPVAIENARLNCLLNDVCASVELKIGTTDAVAGHQFDSILSNITCEDIVALLPEYRQLLKKGGSVICAGILSEKRAMLEKAALEQGFTVADCEEDGQWSGLILSKN
jgi:ribosomal protein L11 methyltransferase